MNQEFYMAWRQSLLALVEALEKEMIQRGWLKGPTTAEVRRQWKAMRRGEQ